ncbi:MAG: nuclear transport factor 2 family protein [Mycobacteriales bacterium]
MTDDATAAAVLRRFWELFDAEEWTKAGGLLTDDVRVEWPHSGELIRGRDNVLALNANYPGRSRIRVLQIVGGADGPDGTVASEVKVTNAGAVFWAASFATVEAGRIRHSREFWVDAPTEGPPPGRSQYTARL